MDKGSSSSQSILTIALLPTAIAVVVLTLTLTVEPSAAGSCGAAKLCCQGRDSGCVIQKASPNAIIESPRDKPCYCDHACLKLGDCCDDFNETCAVVDCAVSEWSEWSECDNKCGLGHQARSRFIVRPDRNGGKPCPETEQSLGCQNYDACRRRARHFQVEEASLSSSRSVEASLDSNFVPQVTRGYCAAFTILKISRGCRRRLESFHEGSRVCVWCRADADPTSANSDLTSAAGGSSCQLDRQSSGLSLAGIGRWELMNSRAVKHCHGKWMGDPLAPTRDNCSDLVCRGRPLLAFL